MLERSHLPVIDIVIDQQWIAEKDADGIGRILFRRNPPDEGRFTYLPGECRVGQVMTPFESENNGSGHCASGEAPAPCPFGVQF